MGQHRAKVIIDEIYQSNVSLIKQLPDRNCTVIQIKYKTGNRKSYMRNQLVPKWPWPLFRGHLRSRQPLCQIHQELLEIKAWFQRTINRKWPTGNQIIRWSMLSRDPQRSNSNSWHQYTYSPISRKRLQIATKFQRSTN